MANQVFLTERDRMLIVSLTQRVKVLTVEQVHAAWWRDAAADTVRQRLSRLCTAGWLVPVRILVRDIDLHPSASVLAWTPGESEPDWPQLIRFTSNRWQALLRSVRAIVGTRHAANHFGGQPRYPRPSEATHDTFLGGVYLRRLAVCPVEADAWSGEGQMATEPSIDGGVVPDALIRRSGITIAVEVVGESYVETKLRRFHEYCRLRNWRYELW